MSTLEGASHYAFREACASLEDAVLVGGPPDANGVVGEAPSEIAIGPSFSSRLANVSPRRKDAESASARVICFAVGVGPSFSGRDSWLRGCSRTHR